MQQRRNERVFMLTSDTDGAILRSGTRVRASVRCLPRGQFQQIRKMFDRLSIIQTPVTDDEPLEKSVTIESDQLTSFASLERETSNQQARPFSMASAVNYADSYEASTPTSFQRAGSTRQYASSLQRTFTVHAKPILVKTTHSNSREERTSLTEDDSPQRYLKSSTPSLSSTGYESNSSPSIISKRNSLATTPSHDLSSSSSSDERQRLKSWVFDESGLGTIASSFSSDDVFDQYHPTSLLKPVRSKASMTDSSSSGKFIVQTTSFLETAPTDRIETPVLRRKYPFGSTSSTGFQVTPPQRSTIFSPILVQKQVPETDESSAMLSAPRKPPRTFEHDQGYHSLSKSIDEKTPLSSSSSSNSESPTFDLGARSISCMDLTAGVSHALLASGLLPADDTNHRSLQHRSSTLPQNLKNVNEHENIYEELKVTPTSTFKSSPTPTMKSTGHDTSHRRPRNGMKGARPMQKGISEPNLVKVNRTSSPFFSPRGLINRMKRMLPLSLSKQSLTSINGSAVVVPESDDSTSTSSDTNDDIRISRLDHVNRVKNVYDSLSTDNHLSNLFTDSHQPVNTTHELRTLYDYVVHLLPEQEIGYFAHGTGCLALSNIKSTCPSSSLRFKYPFNAVEETTLKYFCFPEQQHSSLSSPKTNRRPEYFRFTLTDMQGRRQHGYCSRFVRKGIVNALCLISPADLIDFYEKILSTATDLFMSYKDDDARRFLIDIYPHRLPNRGDTIYIPSTTVGLYTLHCEYDRRKALIDSTTLLNLSTDTIIKIFSSILYEQKLIFIGNDLGPLTRLISTFVCLLYPFSWPHTYVPILPSVMLDIVQAPTPYIIGILRSCEPYLSNNPDLLVQDHSDILVVDIDEDRLRSIGAGVRPSIMNHILPKLFKLQLKQELTLLKKNKFTLSVDECQQRLRDVFMSIFVQSCYDYDDDLSHFVQSKSRTINVFVEWFTRTQMFELFSRRKRETPVEQPFALTFDLACETYRRTLMKTTPQRITVKSVKRKAASRATKHEQRL